MRVRHLRLTIIIGILALVGIMSIQGYWLITTYKMQEEKFNQTIWLALKNVTTDLNALHNCAPSDLNPVADHNNACFVVDVGCNFSRTNLEHVVNTNFNKLNLNVAYSLWFFDCETNQLEFLGSFKGQNKAKNQSHGDIWCGQNQASESAYYFTLNITGREQYIAKKMQLWLILSVLVLLIEVFFTYTIFAFFKQKRLAELQKDFINNMTHEFKTPIASITIASDVILGHEEHLTEKVIQYTRIIKQEIARLDNLAENVLKAARIEKNRKLIDLQIIDLHTFFEDVVGNFLNKASLTNLEIEMKFNEQNVTIYADAMHFTNLINNLLDNAIKYNVNQPKIEVRTNIMGRKIEIEFADNGIGIETKNISKIFRKFYRVPTGNVHDVKGFGLGLYYVKQVCLSHNWKIKAESQFGKGSVFIITVPIFNR